MECCRHIRAVSLVGLKRAVPQHAKQTLPDPFCSHGAIADCGMHRPLRRSRRGLGTDYSNPRVYPYSDPTYVRLLRSDTLRHVLFGVTNAARGTITITRLELTGNFAERNGRKTLTTVQGIPSKFDHKKILKVIKKEFGMSRVLLFTPAEQTELLTAPQLAMAPSLATPSPRVWAR